MICVLPCETVYKHVTLSLMTKWEYFITPLPLHTPGQVLNMHGDEGWELVQIASAPNGTGSVAYMKREKNQ